MRYDRAKLDWKSRSADADVVLVHEWNDGAGQAPRRDPGASARFRLYFHDTHHRPLPTRRRCSAYDSAAMTACSPTAASCVTFTSPAAGSAAPGRGMRLRTSPLPSPGRMSAPEGELVWIGNWGDDERTEELHEFLIGPVRALRLKARVYGVRYPEKRPSKLWRMPESSMAAGCPISGCRRFSRNTG